MDAKTLTKEIIDVETDYFRLEMVQEGSDNVTQVKSTTSGKQVKFKGIDMKSADDWVILDALNYDDATLISVDAGIEQKIKERTTKISADLSTTRRSISYSTTNFQVALLIISLRRRVLRHLHHHRSRLES